MKTVLKCFFGLAAPGAGIAVSLSNLEIWLRIVSLIVGITVGLLSIRSLLLTIERKKRQNREEEL